MEVTEGLPWPRGLGGHVELLVGAERWSLAEVANIAGALAALATVLTAILQVVRAGTAFTRYERWSRIRQDATNVWEVDHAEKRRRLYLVEFVATSDTRAQRVGYVAWSMFWIVVLGIFMWLIRPGAGTPGVANAIFWWAALVAIVVIAICGYYVPKGRLDRAREEVQRQMGYDVARPGQTGAPSPADLARELRMSDGGRKIRAFLTLEYPDHPYGTRWNLNPEQVRKVKQRFGPNT